MALSRDEAISTPTTQGCSDSRAPRPSIHLDTKPAVTGRPIMPKAPTVKAAKVHGMCRPRPCICESLVMPRASANSPAQKNRAIFMSPWCTRCTTPRVVPASVTREIPTTT